MANEPQVQKLQAELEKVRSELLKSEREKEQALQEIENFRKHMNVSEASVTSAGSCIVDDADQERTVLNRMFWERELKKERDQHQETLEKLKRETKLHQETLSRLEASERKSERLQKELLVEQRERELCMRQAEEANVAAEIHARRVEELMNEIAGTKESLLLVKMACVETNKEREALLAARRAEMDEQKASTEEKDSGYTPIRRNLCKAMDALKKLERVGDAAVHPLELKAAKSELVKAIDNEESFHFVIKELQNKLGNAEIELKEARSELLDVKKREEASGSELEALKSEIERVKLELKSAVSCNEAFVGLSQKLQEMMVAEESGKRRQDLVLCKDDEDARAELESMIRAGAEATRKAIEIKTLDDDGGDEDGKDCSKTVGEDGADTDGVCHIKGSSVIASPSAPHGEHTSVDYGISALPQGMLAMDKGPSHKKKKRFPLLASIGVLVSKMKSQRIAGGVAKQDLG